MPSNRLNAARLTRLMLREFRDGLTRWVVVSSIDDEIYVFADRDEALKLAESADGSTFGGFGACQGGRGEIHCGRSCTPAAKVCRKITLRLQSGGASQPIKAIPSPSTYCSCWDCSRAAHQYDIDHTARSLRPVL
jgi:hypothetical protein